jgi:2-(1,2-epoxy-1,2-dihydrophenyl)acetyl-CoA isomerase
MQPVIDSFDEETGIAVLTFNRPEVLNALDVPTAVAFRAAVERCVAREGVRCLVLKGAGRAFVAGGDVASFGPDPERVVNALLDAADLAYTPWWTDASPGEVAIAQDAIASSGFSAAPAPRN